MPPSVSTRRSPHGERGLKCSKITVYVPATGRSPHGERGLKYPIQPGDEGRSPSLPPRGAWIEIICGTLPPEGSRSRSPHGERGLKSSIGRTGRQTIEVAPPTGSVD